MEFLVVAIKDLVTGRFMQPIYAENEGSAKRWFSGVLHNTEMFKDNPEDFEVYQLGNFKDDFGMSGLPEPKKLFSGKEIINGR